jgi:competence protein ComEC
VLKVTAGARSMLLTGDIERPAEAELVARDAVALASEVLLAPHHGSRTSSSAGFRRRAAAAAVVPVGYRNRFGHPNAEVVARYQDAGIRLWRTDLEGAVTVRLGNGDFTLRSQRRESRRYWQDAPH